MISSKDDRFFCYALSVFMRYPEDQKKTLAIESVNLCNLSALVVSAKKSDLVGPPNRFPIRMSALCFHPKFLCGRLFFFQ